VLVIVDADCQVSSGGIQALATKCRDTGSPVQMLDLMKAPQGASLRTRMLEFAWIVKNHVRALGSARIGGACHLMGTGMALPWDLAASAQLATGHITEDMKLGVDMAIAGRHTQFITEAQVTSEFPEDATVARTQKSRWEHGHLTTLKEELPRLLLAWIRKPRMATLVLAMDLLIPPLALYFIASITSLLAFFALALLNHSLAPALWISLLSASALLISVLVSWLVFARQLLSWRELMTVPFYAAWKAPVYLAYFLNRKSGWTKTTRKV
jgi:cellulose synthase/poly-beta-1,6-N-acetylglucosamine synthase-like glycosyltransferase